MDAIYLVVFLAAAGGGLVLAYLVLFGGEVKPATKPGTRTFTPEEAEKRDESITRCLHRLERVKRKMDDLDHGVAAQAVRAMLRLEE